MCNLSNSQPFDTDFFERERRGDVHKSEYEIQMSKRVIEQIQDCQSLPPEAVEHWENGKQYLEDGQFIEAEREFRQALDIFPLAVFYNSLGQALGLLNRFDEAKEAYQEGLKLDPEHLSLWRNLGLCFHHRLNNPDEALRCYRKAHVLDPNFPEPINDIGTIYFQKGNFDRAERHFREALELDNTYYPAISNLLSILFQKVITKIQQRRLSEPNEVEELAQLLQALKKHAPADSAEMRAACHNTQVLIDSSSRSTSEIYQHGNYAKAQQILEQVNPLIGALPDMPGRGVSIHFDIRGLCHHRLGQFEDALQCYQKSLAAAEQAQENPLIAYAWQRIGSVQLELSQWEQVKLAFERSFQVMVETPKTVIVDEKLGALEISERLTTLLDFARVYLKTGFDKKNANALKDAEYCWLRGAEIAKAAEDEEIYGAAAIALSELYAQQGDLEKAETWAQQSRIPSAISDTEEIGYQKGVYAASNEYGLLHLQRRQFPEAERLFKRTLELSELAGDEYYQALALLNLGSVALHQERYDEAYSQSQRSLRICERCGFIKDKVQNLRNLGIASMKLGNFAEAERYTQESICLSEEFGNKRDQLGGYFTLCQVYAAQPQSTGLLQSVRKTSTLAEELKAYDILGAAAAQISPRLFELGEPTAGADLYNAALTQAFGSNLQLFGEVLFGVLEQMVNLLNTGKKDLAIQFCNDSIEAATRSQIPQLVEAFQSAKRYLSTPNRAIDANRLANLLFYPFANLLGLR